MCNFFSMVITKGGIYHDIETHSHAHIIEKFKINDHVESDFVKIEAIPRDYSKMTDFDIKIDQDIIPIWFNLACEREAILNTIKKYTIAELHLSAVKQNGNAIQWLTAEERTPEVCLAAVKQDGNAIQRLTAEERTRLEGGKS